MLGGIFQEILEFLLPKKWEFPLREFQLGIPIHDFLIPEDLELQQFPNLGIHLEKQLQRLWKIPGKFLIFLSLPEGILKLFHGIFFASLPKFLAVFCCCCCCFLPPMLLLVDILGFSWSFPGFPGVFQVFTADWPGWWWGRSGPGTGLGGAHPST